MPFLTINVFLDRDKNAWKKDVLDILFLDEDVQKILKLSILNTLEDDKLV